MNWVGILALLALGACHSSISENQLLTDFAYHLESGFSLEKVADHQDVIDPVALSFDEAGRMYVVEMRGYMPNIEGEGEEDPVGRIRVLEDTDADGRVDHSEIVLDKLIQPRAVLAIYGGLLYAEPPNLWFVALEEDQPGEKVLVDDVYAVGGNVEHQPNGLMLGLDNWIYSAKGKARYRRIGGEWLKEATEFRGQWGITQDDAGRLFYNDNSNQLQGDYLWPGTLVRNPDYPARQGINVVIADNQQVFPIHRTTGINRGYQPHMLTDEGRLTRFTAACGPLIYRGDQFPEEFYGNAFVAEPAGNLIKRNILEEADGIIRARHAYEDREFMAAEAELFRPVNLFNAPDGSIYVLDFYRGIIQHKTYLTDYLKKEIKSRQLDERTGGGRIYRIRAMGNPLGKVANLGKLESRELVALLGHPNAWHREQAQRLLVERQAWSAVPSLKQMLNNGNALAQVHALWALEGIHALDAELLLASLASEALPVRLQAIRLSAEFGSKHPQQAEQLLYALVGMMDNPHAEQDLHLATALGNLLPIAREKVLPFMVELAHRYNGHPLYQDVLLSGLSGQEEVFLTQLDPSIKDQGDWAPLIADITSRRMDYEVEAPMSDREVSPMVKAGENLYVRHCSGCHQQDGRGRIPVAPPLRNSEWVLGHPERLTMIALLGLQGPITVNGQRYEPPHIAPHMPGLKDNKDFSSEDIAAILSYVRNAWGHRASEIDPALVARVRQEQSARQEMCTEPELLSWPGR